MPPCSPGAGGNAAAELAGIIDELYGFIERNRLLLLLIESVVIDHPELSALYVSKSKQSHTQRLAAFLRSRASSGGLRPLPDPEIGAHSWPSLSPGSPSTARAIPACP